MSLQEHKEELRKRLLKQRSAIPEPEYYGMSADIIECLKGLREYQQASTVHCYVSMNSRREVETHELIKEMLQRQKKVVIPKTNIKERTLSHYRLHSFDDLKKNGWGVLELNKGDEVSVDALDLVIVPMVGGDEQGNRIGYGQGFYDRFLQNVSCPKVGLLFERNILEEIPTEQFDVPLDKIITENRIIDS